MNKFLPLFLVTTLLFLFSCTRRVLLTTTASTIDTTKIVKEKIKVCYQNIDFTTFTSKGKITYTEGKEQVTANFSLRMRKDSIIWLSGFIMGIEGARCLITKDSIFVVDKINKSYIKYGMKTLGEKTGLDLNITLLQHFFMGNQIIKESNSMKVSQDSSQYFISDQLLDLNFEAKVNRSNCKQSSFKASSNFRGQIESLYAEFKPLEQFLFGNLTILKITLFSQEGPKHIEAVFNHNKTELNDKTVKYPFNIPDRYVQRK